MKKIFTLLLTLVAFASFAQVRISQVYGGGGNSGATYNQDFVELFNAGSTTASIGGWSIQYASATGPTTPFNWAAVSITAGASIPAGGYYLVGLATGATGAALSTVATPDMSSTLINMSATAGKIALVNTTTILNGTTACGGATVVDVVGFGNTATCYETAFLSTTGITNAQSMKRANNGCTDVNNNSTDFAISSVLPRNSSSAVNICTSPTITASPNIAAITTTLGVASASQSYNLYAANLNPPAGNLTITPTAGLEISFDNTTFFSVAQNLSYTGSTLASTPIYVRISASASQGALSGATITNSGGGATAAVITVAGGVFKNYYSNASGNLSATATWGDDLLGTVNSPADFSTPFCLYNVVNRATPAQLGAPWDVSGTASKIIVGDGTASNVITTTATDSIKATNTIDVLANSSLIIGNKVAPNFGVLGTNSLVDYNYAGTTTADTVKINIANYHHLTLRNGLKYLKSGTTIVNGDLLIDGTANMNGAGAPFSTIALKGNLTMTNGALIEDSTTGFANRFTLNITGNTQQNINTGTSELRVFRIQRDTTVVGLSDVNINVLAGSKICIGNNTGGDLKLTQKITGTPTFTTFTLGANAQLAIVRNGSVFTDANGKAGVLSTTDANIIINKSTTSATINPGTLKFTPGSSLKDFTVNITTPTKDSVLIANNILIKNSLNLTKGVIVMAAGQTLETSDVLTIAGGSATSYVDGLVKANFTAPTQTVKLFPVGKNKQYSPVEITSATNNNYTVQYFKQPYANTSVNAATLAITPDYHISGSEYWDIAQGNAGAADIKYYYNTTSGVIDATQVSIAHFNGTDWDNIGRTSNGSDAAGTYISLSGISSFSPFTFGGSSAVLPIVLESFSGLLENNESSLLWKSSCENLGDSYILQYSTNGIDFKNIYSIDAIGNCNGNVYQYTHSNATAQVNYYRLALKSFDGRIGYSNILTLKNTKANFETKINVNQSQVALSITSSKSGIGNLNIFNSNGQILFTKAIAFTAGNHINYLPNIKLSNGVYFATFNTTSGLKTSMQFVK